MTVKDESEIKDKKKKLYAGHRERMREKFLESNGVGMHDYEILEIFLFPIIPYVDTKLIAKNLIKKFGSISQIINSEISHLTEVEGVGKKTAFALKVYNELVKRQFLEKIKNQPILSCWDDVVNYFKVSIGFKEMEELHALFLDSKNRLISDHLCAIGSINSVEFDVKEVIENAIKFKAVSIILLHNHPSGDAKPSAADIQNTKKLSKAAKIMNIELHDHFIIAKNKLISIRSEYDFF